MPLSPYRLTVAATAAVFCTATWAQAPSDIGRPPAVIPIESEPPPKLRVYPPLPEALARGVLIVQYRTENLRVIPVFGKNALDVSPRVGHLHVTVDDKPGTWAHTSGDPIIVVGLEPGRHKILVEVSDPNHAILTSEALEFTIPDRKASESHGR